MEKQLEKYQTLKPLFEDFNERIKNLIKFLMEENQIKYHLIEHRTKSLESFKGKIVRKDNKYSNPIEEITDLAGVRIILYYQDDVEKIEELLNKEFFIDKDNTVDKGTLLKTNEFGYQSVHYVVQLSENRKTLLEWKKYSSYKVEIQIRTVLQHSWASISHELEYKKNYEIPSILQRKLFRLAGLIELADEEFKNVRDRHVELVGKILKGKSIDSTVNIEIFEELNLLTLKNYISKSKIVSVIIKNAIKAGFDDDIQNEKDWYFSQIINYCNSLNIKTISEFDSFLNGLSSKSYNFLKAQKSKSVTSWAGSPAFYILLLLINENINNIKDSTSLVKEGWNEKIASTVLKVCRDFTN